MQLVKLIPTYKQLATRVNRLYILYIFIVCIFGNSNQLSKLRSPLPLLLFDNISLEVSESVKNLGLRMDSAFCGSPHVSELSRKIFCTIGRFRRWKNVLPLKTKISLTHAPLLPILEEDASVNILISP